MGFLRKRDTAGLETEVEVLKRTNAYLESELERLNERVEKLLDALLALQKAPVATPQQVADRPTEVNFALDDVTPTIQQDELTPFNRFRSVMSRTEEVWGVGLPPEEMIARQKKSQTERAERDLAAIQKELDDA